ncbi:conserved Plasmodium protein, unknown function [Plasmodium knowlesi strain H]|uniref:Uncharacterized protein n=3 Tax=Plasmodium knowlesi TaxID=5850 RepID=A0A5K1V5U0_PLAKH|nr:conserved Plasmodium protein, unknown function [Plasmodium knowlesi strain H]OTN66495.1 Uncharacterized protein PKNOH_S09544200 [Plasmodium knowlesi]CAA9989871.1 conserved Plasmodium protein, unknown function [Plasmodium knowlesi strain H]SBO24429.1 conserved Plasmodium protein, unknown function [Plasmodium knowlesi strain H]SBO26574.1 conserved Plasmodium protein, unknown function [Plasmodium knowlesi strain H]VVS79345.1 conserved Plasmodium protein, unknown function [Plasmodium knowlesi s|eukprot:XP_002259887.1 hypothetical protein, conserved in Plasmodium species [Plasmodium knowlesi strain H]
MDIPEGQKPRERNGKSERSNLRDIEEAKKIRNQQNEAKLKKFCGSTDFVLDVPNIDEGVKFLKYDVDNDILNFNYTTMMLNEKVERLNDVERNIHIPMDLPFLFSFNMQNNDDISNWIKEQNETEHGKIANVEGAESYINLNDEVKQFSSSAPIVHTFEKDDLELLNRVAPHYIRRVRNSLLQCEERKSRDIDPREKNSSMGMNTHEESGKIFENVNIGINDGSSELMLKCGKRKVPYELYFPHPLKKGAKVKKIYPLLPHVAVWNNKYIQGIMEIGNSSDYIRRSVGEDGNKFLRKGESDKSSSEPKKQSSGMLGLLHLVEKTRDKHLYGLYKAQDMNCDEYILNRFLRKYNTVGTLNNGKVSGGTDDDSAAVSTLPGGNMSNQSSDTGRVKKKISLSKFLIKKYLLKLKMKEKLKGKLTKGEKVAPPEKNHEEEEEEDKFPKLKNERNASVELTHHSKRITFNETNKYEYVEKEKELGEHRKEDDTVIEHVSYSQSTPPVDNVECFKYVRDYKSPSFGMNQNDPLSYVIGFNENNLAFMFPTVSRKIIFSKTGQQKRKNYILVREK